MRSLRMHGGIALIMMVAILLGGAGGLLVPVVHGPAMAASQASAAPAPADVEIGGTIDLETAQSIAEHLRQDPLFITEADADRVDESAWSALRERSAALDVPVYVVVVNRLDALDGRRSANLISAAVGEPGLYFLIGLTGSSVAEPHDLDDEAQTAWYNASRDSLSRDSSELDLSWAIEVLETMADPEASQHSPPGAFETTVKQTLYVLSLHPYLAVILLAAVLLTAVWLSAQVRISRRRRRYRIPESVLQAAQAADRRKVTDLLDADSLRIAERLAKMDTAGASPAQTELVTAGLDAYAQARRIADDPSSEKDDLGGALVLVRLAERAVLEAEASGRMPTGWHRLTGRLGGGRGAEPLPMLCSINPAHGDGRHRVDAGLLGDELRARHREQAADLKLHACAACARAAKAGEPLPWLRVVGKPYFTRPTVWATSLYGSADADLLQLIRAEAAQA